jgi:putative DNA primase/helicase
VLFGVEIPKQERIQHFEDKLFAEEGDGILGWQFDGLAEWRRIGLDPPQAVLDATEEYLSSQDTFAEWVAERCEVGKAHREDTGDLYRDHARWCQDRGEYIPSSTAFGEQLGERGFAKKESNGRTYRLGLKLRPDEAARPVAGGDDPGFDVDF